MSKRVAIIEAKRTPIGKFLGAFRDYSAVNLATDVSRSILATAEIDPARVDEVVFGHARQAGNGPNTARQVTVASGIPQETPAATINAACGSGLKSIAMIADSIQMGRVRLGLAGGMENMTQVPFMLEKGRLGYRLGHAPVVDGMYRDGFLCRICDMVMGETAEVLAEEYRISREEQDAWAAESQNRVEAANADGVFANEIVPVTITDSKGRETIVTDDEHPRTGVTASALGKLPPVFSREGSVTAGNASGITDGAAAVLLASEGEVSATGKPALGYIRDIAIVGVDPRRMGIGPVPATNEILKRNGLTLNDIAVIELNEAFAAQAIACHRELEFDLDRVNPNGGAISLGHPIGCTGTRIVVTLLHEMKRTGAELGLATLCVSGGLGYAMLLEQR